jgi:hypothetical protein
VLSIHRADAEAITALDERLAAWKASRTPDAQLLQITLDTLRPVAAELRDAIEADRAGAMTAEGALAVIRKAAELAQQRDDEGEAAEHVQPKLLAEIRTALDARTATAVTEAGAAVIRRRDAAAQHRHTT